MPRRGIGIASVNYSIEFPKVNFDTDFVRKLDLPKLFTEETLNTRTRIVADTLSGHEAEGGSLRPYSESYGAFKRELTGSDTPNLLMTGELHRAIVPVATSDGVNLAFQGSHAPSRHRTKKSLERAKKRASSRGEVRQAKALAKISGVKSAKVARARGVVLNNHHKAKLRTQKSKGSGGRSISNAALAQALYDKGFVGWFQYARRDIDRVANRVLEKINANLKSMIDIK